MWRKALALPSRDSSRDRIAVSHDRAKLEDLSPKELGLRKPEAYATTAPTCRFEVEDLASLVVCFANTVTFRFAM